MKIKKRKFNLLKIFSLKKVHWNESLKLSDRGIKFIESQRSLILHHLIIRERESRDVRESLTNKIRDGHV